MFLLPLTLALAVVPAVKTPKTVAPKIQAPKTIVVKQITIGENRPVYGRYGFRSALEGLAVYESETKKLIGYNLELFQGKSLPRFDDVWDNGVVDLVERDFRGIRWNQTLDASNNYGIHAYSASDENYDGRILKSNEYGYASVTTTSKLTKNYTLSTDHAYTSYRLSKNNSSVKSNGTAMRYQLSWLGKSSGWSAEYERIDPSFTSKLGSTLSDREKFRVSTDRSFGRTNIAINGVYYHNNVGNKNLNTTHDYTADIKLEQKSLFKRPASVGSLLLRHHATNGPSPTDETSLTTSWKDKLGDVGLQATVGCNLFTPGQPAQKLTMTTNISASSVITRGNIRWRPSITIGSRQNRNDLYDTNDVVSTYAAGIGLDIVPSGWSADAVVGTRLRDRAADNANDKHSYANLTLSYKPSWEMMGAKPVMSLKWLINSYTLPSKKLEMTESRVIASLSLRF